MKIKEGDVFEVKTPRGKAYLHYVFKDRIIGELVRVLPGLYSERPDVFGEVVRQKEMYMVFFPLPFAYRRKIVDQVFHYPVNDFKKPKYMRDRHVVRGEFKGWNIIDTETWKSTLVWSLDNSQKELSPWGVWNDTLLIERLTQGWNLESWS